MNSRYGSFEMQRMRITIQKGCQKIDFTDVCRLSIVNHLSGESREGGVRAWSWSGLPAFHRSSHLQLLDYRGRFSVTLAVKVNSSA